MGAHANGFAATAAAAHRPPGRASHRRGRHAAGRLRPQLGEIDGDADDEGKSNPAEATTEEPVKEEVLIRVKPDRDQNEVFRDEGKGPSVSVWLSSNRGRVRVVAALCGLLIAGVSGKLMRPPVNALRLALHPEGLAPRTINLAEWRSHLLVRLRRQIEMTADAELIALLKELETYPAPHGGHMVQPPPATAAVLLSLRLQTGEGLLSLFSTVTVFGPPIDVTVAELALECFYPADAATAEILQRMAKTRRAAS